MADLQTELRCARTAPAELAPADFESAAAILGCEVAAVKAVTEVEAPCGAFDDADRPTILFERHLFSHFTSGQYDAACPDISNPVPGGYGKYSGQYGRLGRAYDLDATAALRATSWGAFQILANNFVESGYQSPQTFVAGMWTGARQQLDAFMAFIAANHTLRAALQDKHWATFARLYNGPGYAANKYDAKLAAAYAAAK